MSNYVKSLISPMYLHKAQNRRACHIYVCANSVDSDQTARKKQSDQDLLCLHSFYIFWRHYFIVKLNCFILRTTTVVSVGVPIFRVFTVVNLVQCSRCSR